MAKKKKKAKLKPLKVKKYWVHATVEVPCTMTVEADSPEEAFQLASYRGDDEWVSWATGPGRVDLGDLGDVEECD
jgi:hypothetical protein